MRCARGVWLAGPREGPAPESEHGRQGLQKEKDEERRKKIKQMGQRCTAVIDQFFALAKLRRLEMNACTEGCDWKDVKKGLRLRERRSAV